MSRELPHFTVGDRSMSTRQMNNLVDDVKDNTTSVGDYTTNPSLFQPSGSERVLKFLRVTGANTQLICEDPEIDENGKPAPVEVTIRVWSSDGSANGNQFGIDLRTAIPQMKANMWVRTKLYDWPDTNVTAEGAIDHFVTYCEV